MKIEDVFAIATWGQLAFAPIQPRLYFTESRPDKQGNRMQNRIMMLNTEESSPEPIPLTRGPSDQRPVPSPDGKWLGFLSRRSGSAQVWRLPLSGGEAMQVTSISGGVKDFCWSPDGQGLVVVAHMKGGVLMREKASTEPTSDASDDVLDEYYNRDVRHITHQYYKLDGEGFFDDGRDQLVFASLDGEMEVLTEGTDHYTNPAFSADGERLYCLYRAYDPEGPHPGITRVKELSLATREWTLLPLPDWSIGGFQLSPDGEHLAFYATKPEELGYGLTTLYRWDLSRGVLTDLSSATDRSVGDESSSDVPASSTAKPTFLGDEVWMLLSDEGRVTLTAFRGDKVTRVSDQKRVVYDFAIRGDKAALALSDPTHPSGIAFVTLTHPEEETVIWAPTPWGVETDSPRSSADHPAAQAGELAAIEAVSGPVEPVDLWATEADGTRVHTWCLRPTGNGPHPTILEVHGGPMAMYGYRYFHEFQCLVAAGYAVVYTNPRGSQGYGKHFCDAIIGQWGDKDYRDVMTGLDAALERFPDLDEHHLGTAGGSYGGFMVNWIVSHSDRFKAAVTMRSVVNRFSAMGSSDMGWLRVPQYGTKPWWEEPEPYWQQSPLKYASNIHTPLLIEHQEKDFRLPIEQGEQLYSALKYLGRTVEMVLYPDESHGMSRTGKPWHRVHRLRTNTAWFDRYLKSSTDA
ncbi:S9 family peptidase [Alicyclobacillus mengziensis]|uniref:S9 family peptidase n=1 Tax=Alicyclobacillus mengziensis TaxID=2931921 RepID=A0A9X7VXJ0_9BACL|nr:S9 family peptidase [Alicyclobacillus mengziensis]QSO46881.1 S9 family peptidase [Alicyclobacillus mengziensis]